MSFVPDATLEDSMAIAQDFAGYKHVYGPVTDARVLERDGDTFRVVIRMHKSSGPVSAVVDVWSTVRYREHDRSMIYSSSDSERILEVRHAGTPEEQRLSPARVGAICGTRARSRGSSQHDSGVLVELVNVGLSRRFPPMLGWIIEPIARRLGRGSVEDSLLEFRNAVLAHRARARQPG